MKPIDKEYLHGILTNRTLIDKHIDKEVFFKTVTSQTDPISIETKRDMEVARYKFRGMIYEFLLRGDEILEVYSENNLE